MGVLEKKPGKQNWIEHLPAPMRAAWNRSIIYRAAVHMHRERGMPVGMAIASAINWAKHICATGDVKQWKGPQSVKPSSRASACAAVALWTSMKAAAKTDNSIDPEDWKLIELAMRFVERQAVEMARAGATLDLAKPGLVPAKVKVRNKSGKVFERTVMVRPEQAKQMQGKTLSKPGLKVTKQQGAVLQELAKIPKEQRPKGWKALVKAIADPRHGGRLGPEGRKLMHTVAKAAPKDSPLRQKAAGALRADAATPGEKKAKVQKLLGKTKAKKPYLLKLEDGSAQIREGGPSGKVLKKIPNLAKHEKQIKRRKRVAAKA